MVTIKQKQVNEQFLSQSDNLLILCDFNKNIIV